MTRLRTTPMFMIRYYGAISGRHLYKGQYPGLGEKVVHSSVGSARVDAADPDSPGLGQHPGLPLARDHREELN